MRKIAVSIIPKRHAFGISIAAISLLSAAFAAQEARAGEPISQGKPVTSNAPAYGQDEGRQQSDGQFSPAKIVDGELGDIRTSDGSSYWLGADGVNDAEFTIDLGGNFKIDKISLQDTHNHWWHDRGTRDFVVTAATDIEGPFWVIAGGSFSRDEWMNLTMKEFPVPDTIMNVARYVRVHALNSWGGQGGGINGRSVGLNEVQVFGAPAAP
jgi:hypothetical protein